MSSGKQTKTLNVQAHLDIKVFAAVAAYLRRRNLPSKTQSEVVRLCVNQIHANLVAQGQLTPIESVEEALNTVRGLNLQADNLKGNSALERALTVESLELEEQLPSKIDPTDVLSQIGKITQEELDSFK